ncbi:MAG TPA: PilW family protein [Noviherbaspirillum sp.]
MTPELIPPQAPPHRQRGLSLIDLMVGLAVGLIVTLVVLSALGTMSMQRRTAVSGDDAKESGQAALSLIERAAKFAGTGLLYNGRLMCTTINAYRDGTIIADNALFAPLLITDGGSTGSDSLTFAYANAHGGSGVVHLVNDMPNASSNYVVDHHGNLAEDDLALIGVPGSEKPCTLFQVTKITPEVGGANGGGTAPSCSKIVHNPSSSYNPPNYNGFAVKPRYGMVPSANVTGPAVITRLGQFSNQTYSVQCNSLVVHDAHVTPTCTAAPLSFANATPLVGNVVQIKAQYGVTDSAASDVVTRWVNATGSWAAPAAADIPRIKAIRIAVVARASEPGVGIVTTACRNAANVSNTGPCSFHDADAPVIDLSGVPVPAGRTWQNYRYRVFHGVIPLRTVLWNY